MLCSRRDAVARFVGRRAGRARPRLVVGSYRPLLSRLAGDVHDPGPTESGMQRGWGGREEMGDGMGWAGLGIRGRRAQAPFVGEDPGCLLQARKSLRCLGAGSGDQRRRGFKTSRNKKYKLKNSRKLLVEGVVCV